MKKTNKRSHRGIAHSRAHVRKLHHARIGLFSLLLLALVLVRGDTGMLQPASQVTTPGTGSVLAYATSMSRSELLSATNSFRAQNGLGPLSLNGQLNTAAQNKAQHMVNHNYWAHDAPDGTTPWYFFDQAGYNYIRAGENLAYGFTTSQETVNGWIGSPGHRANMLGDYKDVGFGFVDGPNYQGGQNTVVVAHYGATAEPVAAPVAPAPAVAPASITPAAPTAPASPHLTAETPAATPQNETSQPSDKSGTEPKIPQKPSDKPEVIVASTQNVTLLQQLSTGKPRLAALVSTLLVLSIIVGFALTHRSFVRHAALAGERFVVAHPLMDSTVIVAVIILILSTSVGRIG